MGDEQKCSKKKKNAPHYQKKGVGKKMYGREIVFDYFFPPVQNSRKVRGHKIKIKNLNH